MRIQDGLALLGKVCFVLAVGLFSGWLSFQWLVHL